MAKKEKSGERVQHITAEVKHTLSVHHYVPKVGEEEKLTVELSLAYSGTIARSDDIVRRLRRDADEIEALVKAK